MKKILCLISVLSMMYPMFISTINAQDQMPPVRISLYKWDCHPRISFNDHLQREDHWSWFWPVLRIEDSIGTYNDIKMLVLFYGDEVFLELNEHQLKRAKENGEFKVIQDIPILTLEGFIFREQRKGIRGAQNLFREDHRPGKHRSTATLAAVARRHGAQHNVTFKLQIIYKGGIQNITIEGPNRRTWDDSLDFEWRYDENGNPKPGVPSLSNEKSKF